MGAPPIITVFQHAPDGGRGLARDMAVRWALEEVGQSYTVRPITFDQLKQPAHRARHPFGQIPTYEHDGLVLFESGAIVLHIAQSWPGLLPEPQHARARALAWMFAAQSTIEPPVIERSMAWLTERDQPWYDQRLPLIEARIDARLRDLAARLGAADWLDGAFSAGDLMMLTVLRRAATAGLLDAHPALAGYVARGEARPAFQRAFAAQRAQFTATA